MRSTHHSKGTGTLQAAMCRGISRPKLWQKGTCYRACSSSSSQATDGSGSQQGQQEQQQQQQPPGYEASSSTSNGGHSAENCTVAFKGIEIKVPVGTTLRTALLRNGLTPHNGRAQLINCRGLGTCGTCAVEIRGPVLPEEWNTPEALRLNFPPHKPPNNRRLRLACQVSCEGDLTVVKRTGFWGQHEGEVDAAAASAERRGPTPPFGELEYILDRRRHKK